MSKPGCRHAYSKQQLRFFGAVAGGHPTKKTTMMSEQAKHHIRMAGKESRKLPEWAAKKALARKVRG